QTRTPRVSIRATPGFNLLSGKLRAQFNAEYYGSRYSDAANTQKLPSYYMFGADLRYTLNDNISFYGYVTNLTNELALYQGNPRAGQVVSGEAGQKYYLATPQFGRTFRVAALMRF